MFGLPLCSYAEKCYRRNPIHFREFSHPHLEKIYEKGINPETGDYDIPEELQYNSQLILEQLKVIAELAAAQSEKPTNNDVKDVLLPSTSLATGRSELASKSSVAKKQKHNDDYKKDPDKAATPAIEDFILVVAPKGEMKAKLEAAAPYNFFLTAITDSKETHKEALTITFQEIFDKSLGEIESTVQINFMVDIGWLLAQYYFAGILFKPLLILYGAEDKELENIAKVKPNVTAVFIKMLPFCTAHAKVMLLAYKDGSMRIIISTANLYDDDWHNRTQGIWMSPNLPQLPSKRADKNAGESSTGFRTDFIAYLTGYRIVQLQPWIERIRNCDFSAINVFFIGSVPSSYDESRTGFPWGHPRVGNILRENCTAVEDKSPIICQSSSIGTLGRNVQAWILRDIIHSFNNNCKLTAVPPIFKMIYPSLNNVLGSHDGILGGGCLPYSKRVDDKQPWLKSYLQQWCAKNRHRSQAMPHIKTYTRLNLSKECIYWFLLTSANLSKAAWGSFSTSTLQRSLRISNYEAGVLFLPRFVTGDETFPLANPRMGVPPFPLPYDIPLTPYMPDDKPFVMDYIYE